MTQTKIAATTAATLGVPPSSEIHPATAKRSLTKAARLLGLEAHDIVGALPGVTWGGWVRRGAYGVVIAARFRGRDVVVKVPSPMKQISLPESIAAAQREAETLHKCKGSDHVVTIVHRAAVAGVPLLVMPRLGTSLAHAMQMPVPPTFENVAKSLARGLADLRRAGVHHYDIHPGNLLADGAGKWVLIDPGPRGECPEPYGYGCVDEDEKRDLLSAARVLTLVSFHEEPPLPFSQPDVDRLCLSFVALRREEQDTLVRTALADLAEVTDDVNGCFLEVVS